MLYNEFQNMHDNLMLSSYYKKLNYQSFETILTNPKNYIKDFLRQGDKLPSELTNYFDSLITSDRSQHTFSIYFLGLYIYYKCNDFKASVDEYLSEINKTILAKSKIPEDRWDPASFGYYWFLVCFFHDLALKSSQNELNYMTTYFDLDNLESIQKKIKCIITELPASDAVPETLMRLSTHYYEYRLNGSSELIDHGFMGGAYHFYDRKKQLKSKLSHCHNAERFSSDELIDNNTNLIWSKYLLDYIHRDVAWIIATHNIWFKKLGIDSFDDYPLELKELFISSPIYTSKSHPLFFLLSLVDMMDFYKFFKDKESYTLEHILKNITIEASDSSLSFSFKSSLEKLTDSYYQKLLDETYRLPYDVLKKDNIITIYFK